MNENLYYKRVTFLYLYFNYLNFVPIFREDQATIDSHYNIKSKIKMNINIIMINR
jgi:hypothetical protein